MDSDLLPFSRPGVDRDARRRTDPGLIEELRADPHTRVVQVRDGRVAAHPGSPDDGPHLRFGGPERAEALWIYLGRDEGAPYLAAIASGQDAAWDARGTDDPQGATEPQFITLRDIGWQLPGSQAGLAATALALANWHATHGFCPRCGSATEVAESGWVRRCLNDGSQHFPRTDPAVIMAITDQEDRLLLGHAVHWPTGQYSVPAGFVEPGESLESAVRREVLEETSVTVDEVTYAASQPWPFPASLMLGFRGRTRDHEATPDGVEVSAARFVTRAQIAEEWRTGQTRLPRPTSIACSLIEEWYGQPLPR
ncbi:NAD(+) diphosphatase [Ruania halotolerans]|uniref:NAD(+) diphosphatase n=1 Tax=Ruania halotolerans TaxID=2897773 RepID=UPI001E4F7F67|nr:NAD(+) diphosphatase [Ruania halotolerans]UFU05565.1 NAD(+) diphosphatase [Ruania halotolerans]